MARTQSSAAQASRRARGRAASGSRETLLTRATSSEPRRKSGTGRGTRRNSAARSGAAASGPVRRPSGTGGRAVSPRPHRLLGWIAVLCVLVALVGVILRALPEELQSLPYIPVLVAATPWFMIPALLSLVLAIALRRWLTVLMALVCLGVQAWWQQPFYSGAVNLPASVYQAMSSSRPDTGDMIARVMTFNVYKGHADAKRIVEVVRDQKVEVLTLQETTKAFVKRLDEAGIGRYLPYSLVSSSDGVSGNGIWSATKLSEPVDDEVYSSASFMPAGTVSFGGGKAHLRFVSVHTTAPVPGYWNRWRLTLDELARMRSRTGARYVFMGDFNATADHTPFRNFLGERFVDAARQSGHGFTFTWPTDKPMLPKFAGIDHVVLDRGIVAGQMQVVTIDGSDHAALLATIVVQ